MNKQTRTALFAVLVLVNSAAIWGQTEWALDHIVPAHTDFRAALALSLGFAAALELTGVVLALLADAAEVNHTPAGGIRLGSYAMGLASGALNLSHWGLNAAGIAFAFLSALSPFLWGIRARVRRGAPAAPSRRFWHPRRSITLIRYMAWEGIATEDEALSRWYVTSEIAPEEVEQAEERLSLLAVEQTEQDWSMAAEIELGKEMLEAAPISPAPSAPAIERAPRGEISPALRSAVQALINGETPEVGGPGASTAVVGRYNTVLRLLLREGPNIPIDAKRMKVKPELVDLLRSHAREVAPR